MVDVLVVVTEVVDTDTELVTLVTLRLYRNHSELKLSYRYVTGDINYATASFMCTAVSNVLSLVSMTLKIGSRS